MPDLTLFASEKYPLRASRLYWFVCQMRFALDHLGALDLDAGGVAAQTGSLTHAGIRAWHEHGRDLEEVLGALRAAAPAFPTAECSEAQRNVLICTNDLYNMLSRIVASEQPVTLRPPDPTGVILIRGTLDQGRRGRWPAPGPELGADGVTSDGFLTTGLDVV